MTSEVKKRLLKMRRAIDEAHDDLLAFAKYMRPDPDDPDDPDRSLYQPNAHVELIAHYLTQLEQGEIKRLIIDCPPRHGKRCAIDTPVLTPTGWTRHGDLKPGDYVFHPDGHPVKVLAVNAPVEADVEVEFTNGEVIRVHEDHLWRVRDRRRNGWRVVHTSDMEPDVWIGTPGVRGSRARWQLPDTLGVEFPTAVLPVHPYVLGAWLGDGNADGARLDCPDTEIFDAITACGYQPSSSGAHPDTGVPRMSWSGRGPNVRGSLSKALRRLGVLGNKHVPEMYLRGDREQRRQLLAGLIDTDGHVEPHTGRVRIVTTSEPIRDAIMEVAASLGYRPYFTTVEPRTSSSGIKGNLPVHTVGFQPHEPIPTRVPRKRLEKFALRRRIAVRAIRRVAEPFMANCIQVDSPDGLYLVGKSLIPTHNTEIATKTFIPWCIGRHPEWHTITGTYSQTFGEELGRAVRFMVKDPRFANVFPEFELAEKSASSSRMETTKRGVHSFLGRGGAATGRGATLIVVDDALKDRREADSPGLRDNLWKWFTQVIATRLMSHEGRILLINTRWHSDDLIGRLTDPSNTYYSRKEAAKWTHLRLPALAEQDDPLGRKPGEALWPARFPTSYLVSQRDLDPRGFSALYQGAPSPDAGLFFNNEDVVEYQSRDQIPPNCRVYAASDHAVAQKQHSDQSVFVIIYVDSEDTIWVHPDSMAGRFSADQAVDRMLGLMQKHKPLIWWAERGMISKSLGPFLRKRMQETRTYVSLHEVTPVADKQSRAQSIKGRMAMQKVRFPATASWYGDMRNQLLTFPAGQFDDWVDALALVGLGVYQLTTNVAMDRTKNEDPFKITLDRVKREHRQRLEASAENQRPEWL